MLFFCTTSVLTNYPFSSTYRIIAFLADVPIAQKTLFEKYLEMQVHLDYIYYG